MKASGIYDYKAGTKSVQLVDGYHAYLAKKAGTSMSPGTNGDISQKFEIALSGRVPKLAPLHHCFITVR